MVDIVVYACLTFVLFFVVLSPAIGKMPKPRTVTIGIYFRVMLYLTGISTLIYALYTKALVHL